MAYPLCRRRLVEATHTSYHQYVRWLAADSSFMLTALPGDAESLRLRDHRARRRYLPMLCVAMSISNDSKGIAAFRRDRRSAGLQETAWGSADGIGLLLSKETPFPCLSLHTYTPMWQGASRGVVARRSTRGSRCSCTRWSYGSSK